MITPYPISAVILAGGKSRRMGYNKLLLRLKPDAATMLETVVHTAAQLATEIIISTNQPQLYSFLPYRTLPDNLPDLGPLAGLEAALSVAAHEWCLLLGGDMPGLKPELLEFVIQQALAHPELKAVVPLNLKGQPEPLCACYHRGSLAQVRAALQAGKLKMAGWLEPKEVLRLANQDLLPFDPDLSSFRNYNTPQDLPPGFKPGSDKTGKPGS